MHGFVPLGVNVTPHMVKRQLRYELLVLKRATRDLPYELQRRIRSSWYATNGIRIRFARGV